LADGWESLKKQVKEANDIVDVVGTYVALSERGGRYKGLCPFHDDHTPSFDVDPRRQRYRCWACNKSGDVFSFIQEHERVDFREALELLARRAGISLEKNRALRPEPGRAVMLELAKRAAQWYHECLLDSPAAEAARRYLDGRGLRRDTIRDFHIGYAPSTGDWLARRSAGAGLSLAMLERIGLIGRRSEGDGYFDRFRDRVMFPIRDAASQVIGFGGRILPDSAAAAKAPKYYNSAESPLFKKSEVLYGIDRAREPANSSGYLAVVEGYTDVLMAHQAGVRAVVSTMGTALNAKHVRHLRRYLPKGRVILVFDADAGGDSGVDRALEIFISHEVDLAIATLPDGMDPCDLLVQRGPDTFRQILAGAMDALDFKLSRLLASPSSEGIEGRRRAVDAVLNVMALAPPMPAKDIALKQELVVNRIAQRLGMREETIWARLDELRKQRPQGPGLVKEMADADRKAPAAPGECQLIQILLAEPSLVGEAMMQVAVDEIDHPGIRQLLQGLYDLQAQGETPDLDALLPRIANLELAQEAREWQEIGRNMVDRAGWLHKLLVEFHQRRTQSQKQEIQNRLQSARDHTEAVDLLRRLQERTAGSDTAPASLQAYRGSSEEGFDGFET
jgi:DNA primase